MIVEITSLAPVVAFRKPAIPPHSPPTTAPASSATTMCSQPGSESSDDADVDPGVGADEVLAVAADVEQAGAEREGDREAGEDQRRGDDQRLLQVERGERAVVARDPRQQPVQPGALEDRPVGVDRVGAGERDDDAADEERDQRGDERDQQPAAAQVARERGWRP